MKIKFRISAISDVGLVRKNNEDNLFIPAMPVKSMSDSYYDVSTEFTEDKAFICVCDGMGGHSSGEVASYIASKETEAKYKQFVNKDVKNKKHISEKMNEFISYASDKIFYKAEDDPDLRTMGTTMTGLYFINGKAYYINVGDSRSYVLNGRNLVQLSTDHADPITKNALTRFLGMSSEYGNVVPEIAFVPSKIGTGHRYLLCSDGLTDMLDDKSIEGILLSNSDGKTAAERLVEEAKKRGGRDNITVIVIDTEPANKIVKATKNKVLVSCIVLALILGAAGAAVYKFYPRNDIEGVSFSELVSGIENAKNLEEAEKAANEVINGMRKRMSNYNEVSSTVDESDDGVRQKNNELKAAMADFEAKINEFTEKVNSIKNSNASDVEKLELLKKINTDVTCISMEQADSICASKRDGMIAARDQWLQWQEEERKRKEEEERMRQLKIQKQKNNTSGSSSKNTNSGSTSSSNTSSDSKGTSNSDSTSSSNDSSGSGDYSSSDNNKSTTNNERTENTTSQIYSNNRESRNNTDVQGDDGSNSGTVLDIENLQ